MHKASCILHYKAGYTANTMDTHTSCLTTNDSTALRMYKPGIAAPSVPFSVQHHMNLAFPDAVCCLK